MPVITAGLYEVVLFQTIPISPAINVFWYVDTGGSDNAAFNLASAFDLTVLPILKLMQNNSVTYDNIRVTPVFGTGVEVNFIPTTPGGTTVGAMMNAAYCASIRLFRTTNETRSGWKRFSGMDEDVVNANNFTGAYLTVLNQVAGVLNNQIVFGGNTFTPNIVRKPFSTKDLSPDWLNNPVGVTQVLDRPTTQVSRKNF